MLLAEVLIRKRNTEEKIRDLEDYLIQLASSESTKDSLEMDDLVSRIYALLDEYQQQIFTVDRANNAIEIKIGNSKTTLASTIRLREIIEKKIKVLSNLITACKYSKNRQFSVVNLVENRDKLLAEYDILTRAIKTKDWTTELTD